MREIKFRAWYGNEMHYEIQGWGEGAFWTNFRLETFGDVISTIPVMQFTGLKDKNGKEIYEGDVIEFTDDYGSKHLVEVKWGFWELLSLEYGLRKYVGIIKGNIHQNPELIQNHET